MDVDVTRFLDNVVDGECYVFGNVFLGGKIREDKKEVLTRVAKSVVCRSLFGEDMGKYKGDKYGVLLRGVGSLILDLRRWKIEDRVIYDSVVCARDDFLKENKIRGYKDVLFKQKGFEVYEAVDVGMKKWLKWVA